MIRAALISLLVISVAGCASRSEARLQELYDSATAQLWRGELTNASSSAKEGETLAASQPTSPWPWKFKLLIAEIEIVGRELAAAAARLKDVPPAGLTFEPIAAKQRYLQGQLAVLQGNLAEANAILDDAARRARQTSAPDVHLDIRNMQGQVLILQRKWKDAEDSISETIRQAQQQRDQYREAIALQNLGTAYLFRDRFDDALQYFERVLANKSLEPQLVYQSLSRMLASVTTGWATCRAPLMRSAGRLPRMNILDGRVCTTKGHSVSWATRTCSMEM